MSDHRDRPTRSGTKAQATAPTASRWPWPLHRKQKPRKTLWESIRETFDSILIALVLASIFRTYVMEAFEIPTGSMAPTLFGRHVDVTCPSCGYTFSVGLDRQGNPTGPLPHEIVCPMCGSRQYIEEPGLVARDADILDPRTLRITGGDRILVDKGSYTLNNPKRWDVGVFVNPHNHSDNYIKRIVGLPGEQIRIRQGEVLVDGVPLEEPYAPSQGAYSGSWKLSGDEYFVLGDNRIERDDQKGKPIHLWDNQGQIDWYINKPKTTRPWTEAIEKYILMFDPDAGTKQ